VLHASPPQRSKLGRFAGSFSRASLLDEQRGTGWPLERRGGRP